MGFRSSAQLSSSPRASGHWWCIIIIVNDGEAADMYCRNKVRWCVIIINDGTFSLRCPLGCIRGQDGLSADSWIQKWVGSSSTLKSFSGVGGGGHGIWAILLPRRIWHSDLELVWGSLLDAVYGCSELGGCLEDAISGRHYWDGNGEMFVPEHVHDMFATSVAHDGLDASIMLEGRTDVPHIQCVKTP